MADAPSGPDPAQQAAPAAPRGFPAHWVDLPAFAGVLIALTALSMPWVEERDCPLFEECGPWRSVSGWEEAGPIALPGLVLALGLAVLVRGPVLRRGLAAAVVAILGIVVAVLRGWMDFTIFGDRVVVQGYSWFMAGVGLAFVGWVMAAALAEGRRGGRAAPAPSATEAPPR